MRDRVLHFAQGSFRQRTHVRSGGIADDLAFWGLVMIYEIGYLPLRGAARPRIAAAALRRWREGVDAVESVLRGRGRSPVERLAGGFAADADDRSVT